MPTMHTDEHEQEEQAKRTVSINRHVNDAVLYYEENFDDAFIEVFKETPAPTGKSLQDLLALVDYVNEGNRLLCAMKEWLDPRS